MVNGQMPSSGGGVLEVTKCLFNVKNQRTPTTKSNKWGMKPNKGNAQVGGRWEKWGWWGSVPTKPVHLSNAWECLTPKDQSPTNALRWVEWCMPAAQGKNQSHKCHMPGNNHQMSPRKAGRMGSRLSGKRTKKCQWQNAGGREGGRRACGKAVQRPCL